MGIISGVNPLARIRLLAGTQGAVVLGMHARDEAMADDDVFREDVVHALANATDAIAQDDAGLKFKAYGPLLMGEAYAVVVNVHPDHLYVVTCHFPP